MNEVDTLIPSGFCKWWSLVAATLWA